MLTSTGKDWKIILLIIRLYKSGKTLKKPNTQYTQISLAPKEFLYQNSLGNLINLDVQTNEELPSIYRVKWGALLHQR